MERYELKQCVWTLDDIRDGVERSTKIFWRNCGLGLSRYCTVYWVHKWECCRTKRWQWTTRWLRLGSTTTSGPAGCPEWWDCRARGRGSILASTRPSPIPGSYRQARISVGSNKHPTNRISNLGTFHFFFLYFYFSYCFPKMLWLVDVACKNVFHLFL